jgi:hypothetical protein
MTTTFDERERAFENKFAHDEEMAFKAVARRNRMVGLWAAGLLGKTGEAAEAYSMEVVRAALEREGQKDVVGKLVADLGPRSDEREIRAKMDAMLVEAKGQLLSETD